jgi:hypothetical protein
MAISHRRLQPPGAHARSSQLVDTAIVIFFKSGTKTPLTSDMKLCTIVALTLRAASPQQQSQIVTVLCRCERLAVPHLRCASRSLKSRKLRPPRPRALRSHTIGSVYPHRSLVARSPDTHRSAAAQSGKSPQHGIFRGKSERRLKTALSGVLYRARRTCFPAFFAPANHTGAHFLKYVVRPMSPDTSPQDTS